MDAETWWVVMRTPAVALWSVQAANRLMLALTEAVIAIGDHTGFFASLRVNLLLSLPATTAAAS
jgi:hypothetical protein